MNSELVRALDGDAARQLAVGDVSSTRTVYAVVLALVAIGVVLAFIGAWIVRQTKPDLELFAPLERMADRSWRHQNPEQRCRTLDEARPDGVKSVLRETGLPEVSNVIDDVDNSEVEPHPDLAALADDE